MLIVNPGTRHFNPSNGLGTPILTYSDYASPGTTVQSLNNNPAAQ